MSILSSKKKYWKFFANYSSKLFSLKYSIYNSGKNWWEKNKQLKSPQRITIHKHIWMRVRAHVLAYRTHSNEFAQFIPLIFLLWAILQLELRILPLNHYLSNQKDRSIMLEYFDNILIGSGFNGKHTHTRTFCSRHCL